MTSKLVKVEFSEQSKCVTARCSIQYDGDNTPSNEAILEETQKLFNEAQKFSIVKSMKKL